MLYLNKKLVTSSRFYANQFEELKGHRAMFNAQQSTLSVAALAAGVPEAMVANQAALLPDDAWRDIDEITKRVTRNDEGQTLVNQLMPLARTVNIGKTATVYRRASDTNSRVTRSLSGQDPTTMDKVVYTFEGNPIPIFKTGYGLNWREWTAMQSEGFDGLADDQEAAVAALNQNIAQYMLDGDTGVVAQSFVGTGIKTSANTNAVDLDASGANIDLTSFSTTSDAIEAFVNDFLGKIMDDNFIQAGANWHVSPEIARRLDQPYSLSAGFKGGSMRDELLRNRRINSIDTTFELTGNEFVAFVPDSRFIQPLVGMATATFAEPRLKMVDDYNFDVMAAVGIAVKADANSRSGVFYAREIP